jgi:myo-inositol-1(or 4)-monophosphatase
MTPSEPSIPLARLRSIAVDTASSAAALIRASDEHLAIDTKSTATDIVTATDIAAERRIRELIAEAAPGSRVLGEEGGHTVAGVGDHGDIEWIVDPIDGTVNFAYRIPMSAVSVAAAVDGRVVAGAVVDVDRGEVFSAHRSGGATIGDRSARAGTCDELALALIATGFAYDAERRRRHGQTIAELLGVVRDIRGFGSAALHLCWVAAGRVDAYVERDIKPWDYAAGALIAAEAGAVIELPCMENDTLVLAANPSLHAQLRALVT